MKQNSLTFDEEKTLNNLKRKVKEEDLIINKSDKGNAAVVNKRSTYVEKMEQLFSDKSKFELIEQPDPNLIQKREKDFNDRLYDITDSLDKSRELVDENGNTFHPILQAGSLRIPLYKRLHSAGAKCAIAYGLTKVHKSNYPIRPIISTIGTYNYNTSGYLSSVLQDHFNNQTISQTTDLLNNENSNNNSNNQWRPLKQRFQYTLKDSFDFINKVSNIKLKEENFIISIDVESLFTNVPIDETLEIIKKAFFKKKSEIIKRVDKNIGNKNIRKGTSEYEGSLDGLPWEHFEYLIRNCLQESIFIFNKKYYKQKDGVSMGIKLGPIISDIFMNDFETKHMPELIKLGVLFWVRFVDDIFAVIKSREQAEKILEFLNSQHKTIKFTMEKEVNNSINFLDVKITKNSDNSISTSTYRKPTFTGVMLNWNSLTSIKYKKGLISCLLDRSNKICSSEAQKVEEMEDLRNLLIDNNYPPHIVDNEFKRFEKYKQLNVERSPNPDEKIKYLSIPFINDKSEIIGRKMQQIVKEYFPNVSLRVAFKAPATLESHFPYKDKVTDPSKLSMVVYKLNCLAEDCDASYIGESKRICNIRMEDHATDPKSHVHEHHNLPGHEMDFANVEILDRANTIKKLELKEMLYIRKLKPSLNKQLESELFTLIIRNVKLVNSITSDAQRYHNKKPNKQTSKT